MRSFLIVAGLCALTSPLASQNPSPAEKSSEHVIVAKPADVAWSAAPAILPAGAKIAVLEGDPGKAGPFTLRLSMPAGYRIPPHYHPVVEHVTVISGAFHVGMGATFDKTKGQALPSGTFAALPAGMQHYAWTEDAAVIQLHGIGPWSLVYVNSADDPRK